MSIPAQRPSRHIPIPRIGFGDRLRRIRLTAEMDQGEFGAAIDRSKQTISRYELLDRAPQTGIAVAEDIEDVFGIPREWLLFGRYPAEAQPTD